MSAVIRTSDIRVSQIVRQKQGQVKAKERWKKNWDDLARIQARFIQDQIPSVGLDMPGIFLHQVLPDKSWQNQRCFIIGGGPSLKDFDFSKLKGELVIGINRAFEKMDCTIAFSMDSRFFQWVINNKLQSRQRFLNFQGFKVWINTNNFPYRGVYILAAHGPDGLSQSMTEGICHGSNSGHAALNLATCLGANPIYLLGYDMRGEGGKQKWWHDGYPLVQPATKYKKYKERLEKASVAIKKMGIRIVNLNPESALKCFEFGRFEDIPKIERPVFISYYTKNTGYEEEAKRLKASLRRWNLKYEIRGIDDLGSWDRNTHYKAQFILAMLEKYKRSVVFVDADAVVRQYPFLFNDFKADMAAHFRDYEAHPTRRRRNGRALLSGTLYFGNTKKAIELLNAWIAENRKNPGKWEQGNLQVVVEHWDGKFKELPAEYCKIFDSMKSVENPVIEHYQASRRLRREINHG